jgi:hypothetical protein
MRDKNLKTILPFLADDLVLRNGGLEILPCTCPPGGPCLGIEDEPPDPDFVIVVNSVGEAMSEPSWRDLDAGPDGFEPEFFVTEEGAEELERQDNRDAVANLGQIVDNMVYIVGMYTGLVQQTDEG